MAILEVLAGPTSGSKYKLRPGETVIGRDGICDIVLAKRTISRRHTRIVFEGGDFYVEDLNSINGTFVNGKPLSGRRQLASGDRINIYEVSLAFHADDLVPETTPPPDVESTPTAHTPAAHTPTAHTPTAHTPTAHTPTAHTPAAHTPAAHTPAAHTPAAHTPAAHTPAAHTPAAQQSPMTTIEGHSDSHVSAVAIEKRLQSVVEINRRLGSTLNVDEILPKVLDILFEAFPQAVNGQILLLDANGDLMPRAFKQGRDDDSGILTFVPTKSAIAKQVVESGKPVLSTTEDDSASVLDDNSSSVMCAPVLDPDHRPLGAIEIETNEPVYEFVPDDLKLLSSVGIVAGQSLSYARTHEEQLMRDRHRQQLESARQVQMRMLPRHRPDIEGYSFADFYQPAQVIGGDYYFYSQLQKHKIVIALGDVAGKGMPAALKVAQLNTELRHGLETSKSLNEVVGQLNRVECDVDDISMITFILCLLDVKAHALTICNAGHMPPLKKDAGGAVEPLETGKSGLPLGAIPETKYQSVRYQLAPGDMIVMYTDGISEAMDPQNNLYGTQRTEETITAAPPAIEPMVDFVVNDVRTFQAGAPQSDDMCLVGFRRDQ